MAPVWVDGFQERLAVITPGLAVTVELKPHATRIDVTLSGGGFELRGWMAPAALPIYLRAVHPVRDVVLLHPTTPVSFRGFDGGDITLGYSIRDGIVPDVLEVGARCSQLTLDRPSWTVVAWDRTRTVVAVSDDATAVPLSREPQGPVVLELSMLELGYVSETFEVVEKRDPFTKIRWVRPRETVVGWVPSTLLRAVEDEPMPIEPIEAEPIEERIWGGTTPDDSESRECNQDVPIYVLPEREGGQGPRAIEVGRIKAKTHFRAPEEVPEDEGAPQPMLYLDDYALEALAGTGHYYAVATADLKGCTAPRRP